MAKSFPEHPPADTPDSEVAVFDALMGLDDRFTVFHSVGWHRDKGKPDGEADFLVAHPELGMVVLEVKGGGIGFDAGTAKWWSRDRNGVAHDLADPFDQALKAKHALVGEIGEDERWPRGRWVPMGYAVVFPDVPVGPSGFTSRGKREITLGKNDLPSMPQAIEACLRHWQQAEPAQPPGPEGIRAIIEQYGKSWSYAIPYRERFEREERRIVELTDQQMEILYQLGRRNRAAIAGCAGSGKTLLAIEKARQLARAGRRVLLTCFNKPLAMHWQEAFQFPEGVTVRHFHSLCATMVREAGVKPPDGLPADDYTKWLPDGLLEALDRTSTRFDAVIIDEAQDFEADWFEALELMLADESAGIYFAFYDDNQRLYQTDRIPASLGEPFELTKNVRNTNQVGSIVQRFYPGEMRLSGVSGPDVLVQVVDDDTRGSTRHITTLDMILAGLRKSGADPDDIAILTPRRTSALTRFRGLGGWRLKSRDQPEGDVMWETIQSFKGQDRAIVILTELNDLSDLGGEAHQREDMLKYVGCSRARISLIVIAPSALAEACRAAPSKPS
jgi:hypothetical protein